MYPTSRQEQETVVKNYAEAAVMIDFNPAIQTHIGTINMLDMNATPINVIGKDWIILGSISELTQAEFNLLFTAIREHARQVLLSAYRH